MEARQTHSAPVRWLLRAAVLPCLWAWWTVRLSVPAGQVLSTPVLALLALLLTALSLLPAVRTRLEDYLLPPGEPWRAAVAAVCLLLGYVFDLSLSMVETTPAIPCLRTLCRLGGGVILATVVLALLSALRELKGLGRVGKLRLLAVFAALNALTALYVLTTRTVYVWDTAGYWTTARDLAAQPLDLAQLRAVLATTLTLDYNHLLAFPISLVMRLLGGSRAVFLFSISNLYTFPALWALCALGRDRRWGGPVLCALFPMVVYTGLVGFVDTAACALALWAYVVYTSHRPPVSRGVMAGALLVGSFLLRRYFFFFAASFGLAALLCKLAQTLSARRRGEKAPWSDFWALFASCAVCALAFAYRFLLDKVLGGGYGDLYSAYDLGLRSDALLFCRYFGLIPLILLPVLALVRLAGASRPRGRRDATSPLPQAPDLFALLQLPICFLAFTAVQSHGQQHLLMYLPGLAALAAGLLPPAPSRPPEVPQKTQISDIFFLFLSLVVLLFPLIPKAQPASLDEITSPALLPSFVFYGPQRDDIESLKALAEYVDSLSAGSPHTAVVLSSALEFNSDTLSNLRPSLGLPAPPAKTTLQYHGTVDKRDPFNWNTSTADYLIVADPVQTHLGEENQQVMAILAHAVLDGTGPGSAYEALPETFSLQGGVTVRLYRRTRNWTYEDYHFISDRLTALYPNYATLYQTPAWVAP